MSQGISFFIAIISYFSLKQFLEENILKIEQIWRAFKKMCGMT